MHYDLEKGVVAAAVVDALLVWCLLDNDMDTCLVNAFLNFGQGTLPWQPNLWHEMAKKFSFCALAFHNSWGDRKTYSRTKTPDEPSALVKIL